MRINSIQSIMQAYDTKVKSTHTTQKANQTDEVILSSFARDSQYALEQIRKTPDVRMDRIESIKASIQNGTYQVDARQVSEKMLSEIE